MATKKKPAVKKVVKAAKPAPKKAAKPAAKKVAKPAPAKKAPKVAKPVAKKAVKATKPAPKKAAKPAAKKVAKPAPVAKKAAKAVKPVAKKVVKAAKPAPKKAAKPVVKKVAKPSPPAKKAPKVVKPVVVKKEEKVVAKPTPAKAEEKKSTKSPLVSIPQKAKAVTKKEPLKPAKVVIPKTSIKTAVKYEPEFTRSVLDSKTLAVSEGPIVRYSDSDLQEFREIIQRKLDAAKKELNYLQGLITRKDEGGDMDEARYMTMEDGSVSMEREQLSQMASRQITFIDHLEKALMRIESKTYGICRVTGKLIDKARLRAVPHATLSIEAKQSMNK